MMMRKVESWTDWQVALTITLSLRLFYSAVAAGLSFVLHPDPALIRGNALTGNLPPAGTWHYALLDVWERFDTLWYLRIAERGYDAPLAVIFYPLYPAAIRIVSWTMPVAVAALVVSTVAAFFFFWGLLRLAQPDLTPSGKLRMALLVCVWPTSFILFAGYAEPLTLSLIVWAVVFGREDRWPAATACGILAGLSRPSGVLVAVALLVLALRSRRLQSLIVVLMPSGTLGYWAWLRWSGRLSVVEAYRHYQDMVLAPPWASVLRVLRLIVTGQDVILAIKFALVVLVVGLSLRRGVRLEDKLFALAVVLQILLYTGIRPMAGAARYLMPAYPAFIALGSYAERRWNGWQFGAYFIGFAVLNLAWMSSFLEWKLTF